MTRMTGGGGATAPAKGGQGFEVKTINEDDLDNDKVTNVGARKPAQLQALAAAAVWGPSVTRLGGAGTRRRDSGAGMCPDNNVMAAAQLALGFEGRMPNNKARATFEGLPGTKVVRRALAALRDNTDEEEELGDNDKEDGFVVTQNNNTKDNETSGGEAPKVQQVSGKEAHQKTHEEAHHPAYGGGGTLGLSSDGEGNQGPQGQARQSAHQQGRKSPSPQGQAR
jgi:hypothetical protein